jgi:V/A-type H+-transporting ATPase subunit I
LGLIHLALGFLLGAINAWHHSKKHAIGKLAWIGLEIGGFLLVTSSMFGLFPESTGTIGGGIFAVSLVLMVWGEGMMGAVELPGVLGNALSYARIAAVGLAGVVLAELINETLIPDPAQGILLALVLLPILILLHILNTGLAMVEGIVQGGRLNLVEFYSKFFHGGGKAFAPFSVSKYKE